MTLKSTDPIKLLTVRGTSFEAAATEGGSATQEKLGDAPTATDLSTFVKQELSKSDRPELSSAKKVISAG